MPDKITAPKNYFIFVLRGDKIICPTGTALNLNKIIGIVGYRIYGIKYLKREKIDEYRKFVTVHFKNGRKDCLTEWYFLEDDYLDETILGFSGPKDIRLKITFAKEALLDPEKISPENDDPDGDITLDEPDDDK